MEQSNRTRIDAGNAGFTLAEVLAAMLFMAIVLPAIVEGMAIASRAGVVAQRSREATQLADSLLTEKVVTGEWQDGDQDGDCEPDHPGFHWRLTTGDWSEDVMRLLTIEVTYTVQGRESSVRLSTLVPETEQE
jgi:type II secretory pathway pseudopilin PulG